MKKIINNFPSIYITFCVYALIGWIYEASWYLIFKREFINRGVLFGPFLPIYGFGMLILLLLLRKFMKKKHLSGNIIYLSIALFAILTFTYTTMIEYSGPKIYDVNYFLQTCGKNLLILNVLCIIVLNIYFQKSKDDFLREIDLTPILVFLLIWIITTLIEYVSHYFIETYTHKLLWDYSKDFLNINRRVNWDASRNFAIGGTLLLYIVQPKLEKILTKIKPKKKLIITLVLAIPMLIDFIVNVIMK